MTIAAPATGSPVCASSTRPAIDGPPWSTSNPSHAENASAAVMPLLLVTTCVVLDVTTSVVVWATAVGLLLRACGVEAGLLGDPAQGALVRLRDVQLRACGVRPDPGDPGQDAVAIRDVPPRPRGPWFGGEPRGRNRVSEGSRHGCRRGGTFGPRDNGHRWRHRLGWRVERDLGNRGSIGRRGTRRRR